jgi:hypothetical protein
LLATIWNAPNPSAASQLTVGLVPSRCNGGIQLKVSPNPTTTSLTVETTNESKLTSLKITDKMGQVRKQFTYSPSKKVTIDVSNLPADVYHIQALIDNNWTTVSFIKQ